MHKMIGFGLGLFCLLSFGGLILLSDGDSQSPPREDASPSSTHHVMAANVPIPAPPSVTSDAGSYCLNATTLGNPLYWNNCPTGGGSFDASAYVTGNNSNPSYFPFFSVVSIEELVNANGDNVAGGGHFIAANAGTSGNQGYSMGVGFWVTATGHEATGVRLFWKGDPTDETTTVISCRIWDFVHGTSVANGTVSVGLNSEYSCIFGSPVSLVPGRSYVATATDVGPCTPIPPTGTCYLGYTIMNGTNITYACGLLFGVGNTNTMLANPWFYFGNVQSASGTADWMVENTGGDMLPNSTVANCNAVEPIVQ